jgi:hypothetical protein
MLGQGVVHQGRPAIPVARNGADTALYQPSALADARRLEGLLTDAGFAAVSITSERRRLAFQSFQDYWGGVEAGGSRLGQLYVGLPADRRARVRTEVLERMAQYRSGDGLVLEAEALIGRGVRPAGGRSSSAAQGAGATRGAEPTRTGP